MTEKKASKPNKAGEEKKPSRSEKNTRKREMFVEEYVIDFNGAAAAVRAGYTDKHAKSTAWKLLQDPKVKELLDKKIEERKAVVGYDQAFVIENLKMILGRSVQAYPVLKYNPVTKKMEQMTDDLGRAVWQFDSVGANRAAELLGKNIGMFDGRLSDDPSKQPTPPTLTIEINQMTKDVYKVSTTNDGGSKDQVEPNGKAGSSV